MKALGIVALMVALAIVAVAVYAMPQEHAQTQAVTTVKAGHGEVEHVVHIVTHSGREIEVNIMHNRIVEGNTVVMLHEVQVVVEGNRIILKGTHGECNMNVTPEQVRERIQTEMHARVREMNIVEMPVYDQNCGCIKYQPVYKVRVEKRAKLLGIIPWDLKYDVVVNPENGAVVEKPWWLVFFTG